MTTRTREARRGEATRGRCSCFFCVRARRPRGGRGGRAVEETRRECHHARASYPRDEMMGRDDVRAVTRDARGGDSETSSR